MSSPIMLSDADIRRVLSPADAVRWTEEALVRRAVGDLQSPPRVKAQLRDGAVVFTVGASGGDWFGFRAYHTVGTEIEHGVVVAWDASGQVVAIAVGNELGARRTGALGGVAAKQLTHGAATVVAIIGAGQQAWAQLWALSSFVHPTEVRVNSRRESSRTAFAARAQRELRIRTRPVADPRAAVQALTW